MNRAASSLTKSQLADPGNPRKDYAIMASRVDDFYRTKPMPRAERGAIGILKRLLTEDPAAMTAAANASPNHPARPEKWIRLAREADPLLTEDQAARVGQLMRREHYRKLARLAAAARRAAREAREELERADLDDADSPAR
jgi:Spy/CpxP family protein refolding chaperone